MEAKRQNLYDWLSERVRYNDVPRMSDIMEYTRGKLSRKEVRKVLEIHPYFKMNLRQQRAPHRSRMYRPVSVSNLGHWHADIGYFSINKRYAMPITYRAGFLVAKDVLSRYVYATPLLKTKSAESMIRAFQELFKRHYEKHPDVPIKSIAFDQETSVMSNKVQAFLRDNNIAFHAFDMSSSKAKFAENAIRLIREKSAVLMKRNHPKDRWWTLLPEIVNNLNSQPIVVEGKKIGGYCPKDINSHNVRPFLKLLQKKVPAYLFSQFDLAPDLVDFKYNVGTLVRAKLIATSSEVIGNKRSEVNLTRQTYVIEAHVPYVTKNMHVGVAYRCRDTVQPDKIEIFQEDEIVPTSYDDDHVVPFSASLSEADDNRQLRKRV